MHSESRRQPSVGVLWYSYLIGFSAWSVQLLLDYILVGLRCASGADAYSWAVTIISLVLAGLTAVGVIAGFRSWRQTQLDLDAEDGSDPSRGRAAMMAIGGLMSNVVFLVIILVSIIPNTFMDPCARIP
jgi:hypothetical protein